MITEWGNKPEFTHRYRRLGINGYKAPLIVYF